MSFMDRINSIENRMNQLDAKVEGESSGGARQASMGGGSPVAPPASYTGPTFESILGTVSAKNKVGAAPVASAGATAWKGEPKDYDGMIKEAAQKHGVDEALVRAVIRQESAFNPKATSGCGAKGMMQLMDPTAQDLGVKNSYDPHENIMGGTKYLRQLLDRFNGNTTKAIAGYNAGPGAVEKYGGLPPFPETQDYVTKVMGYYQSYKQGG